MVSAKHLYKFLKIKTDFTTWFKRTIEYGFEENIDYSIFFDELNNEDVYSMTPQQRSVRGIKNDFAITLDMAKEISMLQKSELGKKARQYFIDCEKKLQLVQSQQFKLPQTYLEALELLVVKEKQTVQLLDKIAEDKDKVDFYDEVADTTETFDFIEVSGLLKSTNLGRNKFIELLKEKKILMKSGRPYRNYIDIEYFTLVEVNYKQNGSVHIQTRVTQKGLTWLAKILA